MSRILVIEDTPAARTAICRTLQTHNHVTLSAPDGLAGLKIIQSDQPDLVITDILMPVMEGLETIREIRRSYPNLPIIAISGVVETPFLSAALKLGAVCALSKPFNDQQLLGAISEALGSTPASD